MSEAETEYWKECISEAADTCGLSLTSEQLSVLADGVKSGHENYGMAFYSPPASERMADIEAEWKAKLSAKQRELDVYRRNAETAVKMALRQRKDAHVVILADGEVELVDGRTERIQ